MKKNPKSVKPSDPTTKPVAAAPASAPASAPVPKPVAAPVAAPKAAPAPAPVPAAAAVPAPAPKIVAPAAAAVPPAKKLLSTTISASVDVGFGHALYVRGEGAGLSWSRGLLLKNTAADKWSRTFPDVDHPITFKFLIDDGIWSVGENYVAVPGATVAFQPVF